MDEDKSYFGPHATNEIFGSDLLGGAACVPQLLNGNLGGRGLAVVSVNPASNPQIRAAPGGGTSITPFQIRTTRTRR